MAAIIRAKPFVKWAGGKQGLADLLVSHFPTQMRRFYEPFLGGGSVLLTLRPRSAIVSDQNEWLLETYHAVLDDWVRVAKVLDQLPNTKEDYLRIRDVQPSSLDLFTRAAHFIYLNKTCFRGLFRVNRDGQFNVPYGAYQRAYYDPSNLESVSLALANVEFRPGDFELCICDVEDIDFIYFDPPYYKLGGYSDFNRYTRFQFRANDHIRLAAVCNELDQKGVRWAVSNSDTPFIQQLFKGYHLINVENRREINLNSQDRSISELLIVNYEVNKPKRQAQLFATS
jgi:DNA adenine methylase